jgi:hypothetical protein
MDRTSLNLLSIVISGTGIFVVLTKFNVPELNMSFFGENLFAVKRDAIETVMAWIFTSFALIGLLIQVSGEIWGHQLQQRLYSNRFYTSMFVIAAVVAIVVVRSLTAIGNRIAKRKWLPAVVMKLRDPYKEAEFIIDHDGWRQDQLGVTETLADAACYRQTNFENATRTFEQIEKLLELPVDTGDLNRRAERLRPFFQLG